MEQELLFRYFQGNTTYAEEDRILCWVESNPENRKEFDRAHILFAGMALYAELPEAVHKSAFGNRRSRNLLRWSLGAAAVVIALVSGYVGSRISLDALSGQMNTIASVGQQMMLTLPDGTKVQLNSGSSLEYPQVFDGKTRNVRLVGEALFDVTHNPEKPFIVETFASDIQVLGTNFNVIADKERNMFSATLISGSVKVTSRINPQESLIMLPNDVVMLVGDRLQKKQTDNFDDLCWTRGSIHIKKMPFDELMATFERAFNVKIIIEREQLPEINVISGQVRISDGVENALHILQQVSDFTYERDPKTNVIVIK